MNAKQTPLVDILRLHAEDLHSDYGHNKSARLLSQAADEIDRLRTTIERLRAETDNGACACGYDNPADVCLYHSPVVEQLKAAIEKLRGYAGHTPFCEVSRCALEGIFDTTCDCGYDELIAELEDGK